MQDSTGAITKAGSATEDYAEKTTKMKNKLTAALVPLA